MSTSKKQKGGTRQKPKVLDSKRSAKRQALALLDSGFHMGGKITATRDSLHERKDVR